MSQNNYISTKEDKQLTNKSEEKEKERENDLKKIVDIRLFHRKRVIKVSKFIFMINSIYFVYGIIIFVAAYLTRFFIYDPDKFWEQMIKRPKLLILQKFCAGSGLYICLFSIFALMDNTIIYILLNKGGLKIRLQYGIYILLIIEIINFFFSLYCVCYFRNILVLFPILFVFSALSLGITIFYFLLIRKSCISESLCLSAIERLTKYIEQFKK